MKSFSIFKEKLIELYHLNSALALLHWDREVNMPPKAVAARAQTNSALAGVLHERLLAIKPFLLPLKRELDDGRLDEETSIVVREVWREFEKAEKLPTDFVKELARVTSEAHATWVEARENSDFAKFAPHLKKIVELKR